MYVQELGWSLTGMIKDAGTFVSEAVSEKINASKTPGGTAFDPMTETQEKSSLPSWLLPVGAVAVLGLLLIPKGGSGGNRKK